MNQWVFALIVIAAFALFYFIDRYRESLPKKRLKAQEKKEHWGENIKPASGIYWDLGRTLIKAGKRTDSRPYLENLGFTFLGYSNEKLLWVEPPQGWTVQRDYPRSEIFDETGKLRFTYFYKNDIMNMADYRAELHHIE